MRVLVLLLASLCGLVCLCSGDASFGAIAPVTATASSILTLFSAGPSGTSFTTNGVTLLSFPVADSYRATFDSGVVLGDSKSTTPGALRYHQNGDTSDVEAFVKGAWKSLTKPMPRQVGDLRTTAGCYNKADCSKVDTFGTTSVLNRFPSDDGVYGIQLFWSNGALHVLANTNNAASRTWISPCASNDCSVIKTLTTLRQTLVRSPSHLATYSTDSALVAYFTYNTTAVPPRATLQADRYSSNAFSSPSVLAGYTPVEFNMTNTMHSPLAVTTGTEFHIFGAAYYVYCSNDGVTCTNTTPAWLNYPSVYAVDVAGPAASSTLRQFYVLLSNQTLIRCVGSTVGTPFACSAVSNSLFLASPTYQKVFMYSDGSYALISLKDSETFYVDATHALLVGSDTNTFGISEFQRLVTGISGVVVNDTLTFALSQTYEGHTLSGPVMFRCQQQRTCTSAQVTYPSSYHSGALMAQWRDPTYFFEYKAEGASITVHPTTSIPQVVSFPGWGINRLNPVSTIYTNKYSSPGDQECNLATSGQFVTSADQVFVCSAMDLWHALVLTPARPWMQLFSWSRLGGSSLHLQFVKKRYVQESAMLQPPILPIP